MYFVEVSSRRIGTSTTNEVDRNRHLPLSPGHPPLTAGGSATDCKDSGVKTDVQSMFDLDGRAAIVTGASSGLGERFARVLYAAGANVMAAARRTDRLEALAASIDDDARFAITPCDVTSDADCEYLAAGTVERFGRVDVLVNNAGMAYTLPAEVETPDQFREVVDVNLNGLFVLSQVVGRTMIAQHSGSIVNVASKLGLVAV